MPTLRPLVCASRCASSAASTSTLHVQPALWLVSRPYSTVLDRPAPGSPSPSSSPLSSPARPSPSPSPAPAPASPPVRRRPFSVLAAAVMFGFAGYGLAFLYPPPLYKLLHPTPVALQPSKDSDEGKAAAQAIEAELQALPLVKALREELLEPSETSPNATSLTEEQRSKRPRWNEHRPYAKMPDERKRHSLTQFSLRGPGKFAVPPLLFASHDEKECVAFLHVGNSMCGHNGIVHGGLLATILDEAIARPAFFALPNKIGMTVYLNTRYKAPTITDQFLVVKTRCVKAEGRKAWVEGHIEDLNGKRLVECDALYVEPRDAWMLKTSAVKEALA